MAGFLISFAPRVRSSNKQVSSIFKSKQPQEILCKADVLLFWRQHSGLVFIANTIINTVELKVDFCYTTGRYNMIFKILGRFNFNIKLSNCVCYEMFITIIYFESFKCVCLHAQQGETLKIIVFEFPWHDRQQFVANVFSANFLLT